MMNTTTDDDPPLTAIDHPILTEYLLKLLHKRKIFTITDFYSADPFALLNNTNITDDEIFQLKSIICEEFVPAPTTALAEYNKRRDLQPLPTGILP